MCCFRFYKECAANSPKKTIWAYSGYVYEELSGKEVGTGRARCEVTDAVLACVDVLVDGEIYER